MSEVSVLNNRQDLDNAPHSEHRRPLVPVLLGCKKKYGNGIAGLKMEEKISVMGAHGEALS